MLFQPNLSATEERSGIGTTTTLQLVDPYHMNGKPDFRGPLG